MRILNFLIILFVAHFILACKRNADDNQNVAMKEVMLKIISEQEDLEEPPPPPPPLHLLKLHSEQNAQVSDTTEAK